MFAVQEKPKIDILRFTPSEYNRMPPPIWRWERARWLHEHNLRPRKTDDKWVAMAFRFWRELVKAKSTAARERLAHRYPGLYWAWYWRQQDEDDAKTRWTVEAYLCSGATLAQIAARVGEHPGAVGAYAKVFFDVDGKQKHWAWMLNEVIGRSVHSGINDRQYDLLWKLYGLLCGPMFLDMLLRQDGVPIRMTSYNQGSAVADDLIRASIQTKALYAARSIPAYQSEIIFAAYQKMKEIETAADNPQRAQGSILNGLNALTENMNYIFGSRSVESLPIKHYDTDGVEARAADIVAAAFGAPIPRRNIGLMPEPVNKDASRAESDQG